jgi:hypothetical protein
VGEAFVLVLLVVLATCCTRDMLAIRAELQAAPEALAAARGLAATGRWADALERLAAAYVVQPVDVYTEEQARTMADALTLLDDVLTEHDVAAGRLTLRARRAFEAATRQGATQGGSVPGELADPAFFFLQDAVELPAHRRDPETLRRLVRRHAA